MEKVKPTDAVWVKEEVKQSFADAAKPGVVPGILPVISRMIKEQIQQQRRADDRKANIIIFNVCGWESLFPQYGRDVRSQRGYWDI